MVIYWWLIPSGKLINSELENRYFRRKNIELNGPVSLMVWVDNTSRRDGTTGKDVGWAKVVAFLGQTSWFNQERWGSKQKHSGLCFSILRIYFEQTVLMLKFACWSFPCYGWGLQLCFAGLSDGRCLFAFHDWCSLLFGWSYCLSGGGGHRYSYTMLYRITINIPGSCIWSQIVLLCYIILASIQSWYIMAMNGPALCLYII